MKGILEFFKTTIAGGFFVILPVVLIVLVVDETIGLLAALVDPIAQQLPIESLGGIAVSRILSIVLILALCFLTGLVMKTRPGMATVGTIRFVSRDLVKTVDAPMGAAVNCLMHWGLGSHELLAGKTGGDAPKH